MSGQTIKVPFTKALTVLLTKDTPFAQEKADADLKAIEEGSQVFAQPTNEGYFHRLRRRVAEKPELAEKIAVFFQDANGLHEVGLQFEDELKWPPGFMSELFVEECEIAQTRHERSQRSEGK